MNYHIWNVWISRWYWVTCVCPECVTRRRLLAADPDAACAHAAEAWGAERVVSVRLC